MHGGRAGSRGGGIRTYTLDLEYGGSMFGEDSSSRGSIHIVQISNSLATPASRAYKNTV